MLNISQINVLHNIKTACPFTTYTSIEVIST